MKRPSDQAKLLLFALLRSTATALATTGEKTRLVLPQTQNIQLRLATRTDVPSIQSCNLACLPENYNSQFYCSHLRQWPDLALVAEDVSHLTPHPHKSPGENDGLQSNIGVCDQDRNSNSNNNSGIFNFNSRGQSQGSPQPKIVAYVLGKVEKRQVIDYSDPTSTEQRLETLGHVTSLAVSKEYRRLGLAKSLMTQLHSHLQHQGIRSCGLHVRTSNQAACRLYQEDGYEIAQIIPSYYQDGEDAYLMRKNIPVVATGSPHPQNSLFGKKIWKTGPLELRLPRKHRIFYPNEDSTSSESSSTSSSSAPELLTGTM